MILDVAKECEKLMEEVAKASQPGMRAWWANQPFDLFQSTMDDLDKVISSGNERAIHAAFLFARSELLMLARHHATVVRWVEIHRAMKTPGVSVSVRLIPGACHCEIMDRPKPKHSKI